jgi:glutamate carboxypeptidase
MESETISSIESLIQENRNEMIDFLEGLTNLESPSTDPDSQKEVLRFLEDALTSLDYWVFRSRGNHSGGCLYARPHYRDKAKSLQLMVGHCDTVWPLDTIKTMPIAIEDSTMRGPGVYDMKGGLTQMIFALLVLKHLNLEPPVTPVILINSDEEIGSKESTHLIKMLARISERAFILEPSLGLTGKLKTQRKGVGRFTIKVQGQSAHAGLDPGEGASAIVELSHIIQKLFALNDPQKEISVNVGMIEGGIRPNVIAAESTAIVDVRVPTQKDAMRIEKEILGLKSVNPKVQIFTEGSIGRPPMEATPGNKLLWEKAKSVGSLIGLNLEDAMAGGGSDGNTTSLYTPTLDGLGATGDGAHAVHEFIDIEKMMERTALLALLLMMDPLKSPNQS